MEETEPSIVKLLPTVDIKKSSPFKPKREEEITSSLLRESENCHINQKEWATEEKETVSSPPKESKKIILAQQETKENHKLKETPKEMLKGRRYVVKKKDSLWEIAKMFNTLVKDLQTASNLKSKRLDIGHILITPRVKQTPKVVKKAHALEIKSGVRAERRKSTNLRILVRNSSLFLIQIKPLYIPLPQNLFRHIKIGI